MRLILITSTPLTKNIYKAQCAASYVENRLADSLHIIVTHNLDNTTARQVTAHGRGTSSKNSISSQKHLTSEENKMQ